MLCLAFICSGHSMEMQNMIGFSIKDCLTETSPWWKCFGKYNSNRELFTLHDKYIRDFIQKSSKGGRVVGLNRYFESNQCEKNSNTIKKP